jgi:pimeloyl-ACP methyl ester carboxylesterase
MSMPASARVSVPQMLLSLMSGFLSVRGARSVGGARLVAPRAPAPPADLGLQTACCCGETRLGGMPEVMVHGRQDVSGPPDVPWRLARAGPGGELVLLDDVGHGATLGAIRAATDRFAAR